MFVESNDDAFKFDGSEFVPIRNSAMLVDLFDSVIIDEAEEMVITSGEWPPMLEAKFSVCNDNERWPWYVETKNFNKDFSLKWWKFETNINKLGASFFNTYPNQNITFVRGKNLGGLKRGKDKIRFTDSFGRYLIGTINQCV